MASVCRSTTTTTTTTKNGTQRHTTGRNYSALLQLRAKGSCLSCAFCLIPQDLIVIACSASVLSRLCVCASWFISQSVFFFRILLTDEFLLHHDLADCLKIVFVFVRRSAWMNNNVIYPSAARWIDIGSVTKTTASTPHCLHEWMIVRHR